MNPIFKEYYSHTESECYKIKLPWPFWAEHKIVLCPVSDGMETAKKLAKEALIKHIDKVINEPI